MRPAIRQPSTRPSTATVEAHATDRQLTRRLDHALSGKRTEGTEVEEWSG